MAKALETVFSTLTPLQQAAVERIHEYQDELKRYGMFVRSAMELEFTVEDANGRPIPGIISLDKALSYLKHDQQLPHIEKLKAETGRIDNEPFQYEVNIAEHSPTPPNALSPADIAAVTEQLKRQSLSEMLRSTSALTYPADLMFPTPPLRPNFGAIPYANSISPSLKKETSALHVNVSLYNAQGRNLFGEHPELLNHCLNGVCDVQREAALSMLPTQRSLDRLGRNKLTTSGVGAFPVCFVSKAHYSSAHARGTFVESGKGDRDDTRIENRLPGADADPFVAMAVTMAGLVQAVRQHVSITPDAGTLSIAPIIHKYPPTSPLPKQHGDLIETFAASQNASELLGNRLYSALLREYGDGKTMSL